MTTSIKNFYTCALSYKVLLINASLFYYKLNEPIMAKTNKLTAAPIHSAPLAKRMLQGAGIALILIVIFLLGAGEPHSDWPKLWMLKPLVIVPLAGALGGILYYIMDGLRHQGGWKRLLAMLISVVGYLIVLWLGTVLGLNGTWWD